MRQTLISAAIAALAVVAAPAANAVTITYLATMTGPNESPPNASLGTGLGTVILDTVANTLEVSATFANLSGNTTQAHIHCCTAVAGTGNAGVAVVTPSLPGFPIGVRSGSMAAFTFDLGLASSYNPGFVTANGGTAAGASAAFLAGLGAGKAYFNIHTSVVPGGEIRGFLVPVPEPETYAMMLGGLVAMGSLLRRRRA